MNYYEEFGVSPEASPDEIRRAYKALVRLVHPDVHADNEVHIAAERQTKRINEIFAVLANPQKRRLYDQSLLPSSLNSVTGTAICRIEAVAQANWTHKLLKQWYWIVLGAMVLALSIWYEMTPKPSEIKVQTNVDVSSTIRDQSQKARVADTKSDHIEVAEKWEPGLAKAGRTRETLDNNYNVPEYNSAITRRSVKSAEIQPELSKETAPVLSPGANPVPAANPSPIENLAARPGTPVTVVETIAQKWAGSWLYAPKSKEKIKAQYVAEYMELTLTQEADKLSGKYWGRYRVSDQAIPSEVRLQLQGNSPPDNTATLKWTSADGAEGEVQLVLESQDLMTFNWWTTRVGKTVALSSGTSKLVRQRRQ